MEQEGPKKVGGPQAGLLTWVHRLTKSAQIWIMKQLYGNEPEAVAKLRAHGVEGEKFVAKHFPADTSLFDVATFTPEAFLVCFD